MSDGGFEWPGPDGGQRRDDKVNPLVAGQMRRRIHTRNVLIGLWFACVGAAGVVALFIGRPGAVLVMAVLVFGTAGFGMAANLQLRCPRCQHQLVWGQHRFLKCPYCGIRLR